MGIMSTPSKLGSTVAPWSGTAYGTGNGTGNGVPNERGLAFVGLAFVGLAFVVIVSDVDTDVDTDRFHGLQYAIHHFGRKPFVATFQPGIHDRL
jgi:hypothetical protein